MIVLCLTALVLVSVQRSQRQPVPDGGRLEGESKQKRDIRRLQVDIKEAVVVD